MKTSLIDQRHQHCLHNIILVVRVSDLVAAPFFDCLIQGSLAHFCTQRTGIGFLPFIKDNLSNLCPDDGIGNLQFPAQRLDTAQIKALEPQVYGNGLQFKMLRIEPFQTVQRVKQRQGILSAGDSHRDPIPFLDHLIFIYGFSCIA